jgi:hypothetical protein
MYFINNRVHHLMTGTSCVFILTKLSDLLLYYFSFFSICYAVIDSFAEDGYHKASGYYRRFDLGDAWGLITSLGGCSW